MSARAVFLDRDGVLVQSIVRDGKPYAPLSLEEMEIVPGADEAVESLHWSGLLTVVVTNQPDIARGDIDSAVVDAMHERLFARMPLDDIKVCPHDDGDGCKCRKPQPGMINSAARKYGIDLPGSFMIGDRWKDIAAGNEAGCTTIWIDHGYGEQKPEAPDFTVASLDEAVGVIISKISEE